MRRKYWLLILVVFLVTGLAVVVMQFVDRESDDLPDLSSYTRVNTLSQAKPVSALPSDVLKFSSLAYPSELFFGDTCYVQLTRTNLTEEPIRTIEPDMFISWQGHFDEGRRFVISSEGIEEDYTCVPERYWGKGKLRGIASVTLQSGENVSTSYPLELPPLEAMNHPFWKKLREKMTPEGIKCTLTIKLPENYLSGSYEHRTMIEYSIYEHEILIKPRPGKEQTLLDKWLRSTSKKFLPPVSESPFVDDEKRWYTPEMQAFEKNGYRQSGGHYVTINGKKYNPWDFIRDGNRKPPAPLAPTTLEGWEKLENSLVPSTMRDEIQLSRMLIDYHGAKGNVRIQKRDALVQWLKSLPEPQSMSMASNTGDSLYTSLRSVDHELRQEIYPMMSHFYQRDFDWRAEDARKEREANESIK